MREKKHSDSYPNSIFGKIPKKVIQGIKNGENLGVKSFAA